jgi:hypothetical protein
MKASSLMRSAARPGWSSPASAFVGFGFPPEVIVVAVRWYLRFNLSYRDVEELLVERGVEVDHVTVFRWVQRFTPLLADAARFARHPPGDRWGPQERRPGLAAALRCRAMPASLRISQTVEAAHPHDARHERMVDLVIARLGSGGHVCGQDVVGVSVEVLAGPVVAHRGFGSAWRAAICPSRRLTPASSMVVTYAWRSMCGCIRGIRTPAAVARRRKRRVAA